MSDRDRDLIIERLREKDEGGRANGVIVWVGIVGAVLLFVGCLVGIALVMTSSQGPDFWHSTGAYLVATALYLGVIVALMAAAGLLMKHPKE